MKRFAYKFTKTTKILLFFGLAAAIACLVLNVIRFIRLLGDDIQTIRDYATSGISMLIGLAGIIVIIPVILSSSYDVTKDQLTIRMGFIKTKIKTAVIKRVTLFRVTDILVVFYNQSDYIVINVDSGLYDDIVTALKDANGKIFYQIDSDTQKDDLPA